MPGEVNIQTIADAIKQLKTQITVTTQEVESATRAKDQKWLMNVKLVLTEQEACLARNEAKYTILVYGGSLPVYPTVIPPFGKMVDITSPNGFAF